MIVRKSRLNYFLKPRELAIFEKIESYLVENYQITTAVAQELTGLSAATMRRYLQIFVNQGLLEKSGTTKNTLYSLIIRSFFQKIHISKRKRGK